MAKERNLPSKTTLTTSDYIRVVGSDNASYKQLVSDVADTMGITYLGSFSASSDEDTIKSALTALNSAYSSEASSTTNKPKTVAFFRSGAWGFVGTAWIRSTTANMTVVRNDNGYTYFAKDVGGTQTVTLMPTRAEVDALATKVGNIVYYYKNVGTSYTSYVSRLEAFISNSDFPTERAFVGCMLAGSYHYVSGYLDASKNGGIVCINFNGGGLFRVSSGTVTQIV